MENTQLDNIYSYIKARRKEGIDESQLRYELIATGHKDIDVTHYLSSEYSQIDEPIEPKETESEYSETTIPAPSAVITPKLGNQNADLPINPDQSNLDSVFGGDITRKNLLDSPRSSHSFIYALTILVLIVVISYEVYEYRDLLIDLIHNFFPQ